MGSTSDLPKLEYLSLSSTQVTDAGLVHLKDLQKIEYLGLASTQVTDAGLDHLQGLSKLTSLNLAYTQVTGAGIVHMKGLPKLEYLSRTAELTTEEMAELQRARPELKDNLGRSFYAPAGQEFRVVGGKVVPVPSD
jgi:hypothetical protein